MSKRPLIIAALSVLLCVFFIAALMLGSVSFSTGEILLALFGQGGPASDVILRIRLPRILNSLLVGSSLSGAGLILQAALRNNLAEPGLLGISAGAGLGAILVFLIPASFAYSLLMPVAFVFSASATMLIFLVARRIGRDSHGYVSSNAIILTGVAFSALISAVNGFLMLVSGSSLTQIIYWLNGGLSGRGWEEFYGALPFVLVGLASAILITKELNVMNFGEEMSSSLGLDVKKFQRRAVFSSALLAAGAVSVAGIVSFAGLIVPNLARLVIGNDYRYSMPCALLMGGMFMLVSDTLARTVTAPVEIPLGIVTSFIGAPVFIWLMLKGNRKSLSV